MNLRARFFFLVFAVACTVTLAHEVGTDDASAQSGACAHDASRWHPPIDPQTGCQYGHEHGDAPPAWIAAAGYQAGYDPHGGFHGNTSPAENAMKHISMKGQVAQFGAQEAYFRLHLTSNALERSARYHSYEVFLKDAQGGVSHWQGWYNSGDPRADRVSRSLPDPGRRPIVLVTDVAALERGVACEQWYGFTSSWSWDLGLTICNSTTIYFPEEGQYLDFFWQTGWYGLPSALGLDREIEAAWYGPGTPAARDRDIAPKGRTFYATQFGEIVSGPDAPRCSEMTTRFGVSYPNICLPQFVAPTAAGVANPAGRSRKTFPGAGVVVPN